ncbi:hypothetical protein BG011_002621 [Mortierella polycephala]|uniref:MFS general substrate transporter n=1 Tax=Mortierella polycephala TaxID=41804 RepID=A0A9P6Q431_9FUNG|nr:hypothetical protein BG011_002621 [Mortierella polycephala]
MSSSKGGESRRRNIPHTASESTVFVADSDPSADHLHEDSPLLPPAQKATTPAGPGTEPDPTSIYAHILYENLPWYKRPSAIWLLPVFGFAYISLGMLSSSIYQFHASLLCREYLTRHPPVNSTMVAEVATFLSSTATALPLRPAPECQAPDIQAFTAKVLGMIEVLGGIAGTFSIGYYASLSDKHGRIKVMIVSVVNTFVTLAAIVIMGTWWDQIGLPVMFVASMLNGLLGGIGLGSTMSLAYAADCTDPSRRSLVYSWLHAGMFMGLAIGPFLGGTIVRATGSILTIVYIDACISLISLLVLIFVMPESLPSKQAAHIQKLYEMALKPYKKDDPVASDKSNGPVAWHSHMMRSLEFFKPNGQNTNMILLAAISFLQMLALKGTFSVIVLYTNRMFNWTEYEDGILFSLGSTVRLISLLVLLPILVHFYNKWARKREQRKMTAQGSQSQSQTTYNTNASMNNGSSTRNNQKGRNDIDMEGEYGVNNASPFFLGPDDPNVASSVEHLGEAALNLSDDEDSFQERRRRQSTVDSAKTLSLSPSPSSSASSDPKTASASASPSAGPKIRTKEQARSDQKLDTWMIRLGFAINSLTYIGYGLATEGWMFYLWSSLHAIAIIASPSLKSLLTNLVEPSQFGAVLGAIQVVDSIASIFSPILISGVYAMTVKTRPDFVWYLCASLTGACVVLSFMIRQKGFVKGSATSGAAAV